jgi:hypothetical protein
MADPMDEARAAVANLADTDEDDLYRLLALRMKTLERNPAIAGQFAPPTMAATELGIPCPTSVLGRSSSGTSRVQASRSSAGPTRGGFHLQRLLSGQHGHHDGDRGGRDSPRRPAGHRARGGGHRRLIVVTGGATRSSARGAWTKKLGCRSRAGDGRPERTTAPPAPPDPRPTAGSGSAPSPRRYQKMQNGVTAMAGMPTA